MGLTTSPELVEELARRKAANEHAGSGPSGNQDYTASIPAAGDHDVTNEEAIDRLPIASAGLEIRWLADIIEEVDTAPPPRFLCRGLIVAGDYGVVGAEKKAGKTWLSADLAVNVAGGGVFLGLYEIDNPGPVLLFAGEGGPRKIVRRIRAVARRYGLDPTELPIKVCCRAPKLTNADHLQTILDELEATKAVLVIIDPAYLATSGATTSNLVEMGQLLERIQHVAQAHGATLLLAHHWNKTGTSKGADRFTGSGYAEWGRFLMSAAVLSKRVDAVTLESSVLLKIEVTGDELADAELVIRRTVRAGNPDDLTSPMYYDVEKADDDLPDSAGDPALAGLKPAAVRVLDVLRDIDDWADKVLIGDKLADTGHPLRPRTILEAAKALTDRGLVTALESVAGSAGRWKACADDPEQEPENAF